MVKNKLNHYIHHFIIANIFLYVAYLVFGSVTVWEIILFFFMAFIPVCDEIFYAITTYLNKESSRRAINLFLVGDIKEMLYLIHQERMLFDELVIHNLPVYFGLSALLYIFLIFDLALPFYALSGVLAHLIHDLVNDEYELKTLSRWTWPFRIHNRVKNRV